VSHVADDMMHLPPAAALDAQFDAQLQQCTEGLGRWQRAMLEPWKHKRTRTDEDLEQDVDRVFTMYCELDASDAAAGLGLTAAGFLRFCRDARVLDNAFTFRVCRGWRV